MRARGFAAGVVGLTLALLALPPRPAGAAELVLDGLSFFFFEGAGVGESLPAGVTLPVTLEKSGPASWNVTVGAAGTELPPVRYPSGRTVRWRLAAAATGTLSWAEGAGRLALDAPLVAQVEGAARGISFPLHFTTETTSSASGSLRAERQGARLDPATGYLQLVASGLSPDGAATAPGKPFYVVLSGRLSGVELAR